MNNYTNPFIISKTIFNCGEECTGASFFAITRKEEASELDMQYVFDNGTAVGEFARTFYPDAVTVSHSNFLNQVKETQKLLNAETKYICEASFLKDDLFCAVDILEFVSPGHVKITEVKSSTDIKDTFYRDIAYQVYVVRKCGYVVDGTYLMYVNKEYIREEVLDPKKYFVVVDLSEDVFNLQEMIEKEIINIRNALYTGDTPKLEVATCCFKPYECPFWKKICKKNVPENSVFDIRGMQTRTKLKLFYEGNRTMSDYLKTKKQNPKYAQQCLLTTKGDNEVKVDYEALNDFLEKVEFPIASLDFETIGEAIPYFVGQKPYAQTPVQFSMHVLEERGLNLVHYEYIANPKIDWRIELAHKLVEYCPSNGSVIVWNQTMEKHRIEELAELEENEDIKEALINIANRIVDLMVPFRERVVYREAMKGSYSVKYVLPALFPNDPNLSYKDLSINNGMLASSAFSKMLHDDISAFDISAKRQALFTYCELDTYGPLCILDYLYHLIDPEEKELFKKMDQQDNVGRTVRVGDRVVTNIGAGNIVGFTRCFTRIALDAKYNVLRKSKNLINLSGLDLPKSDNSQNDKVYYINISQSLPLETIVSTDKGIGKLVGYTKHFFKVMLTNDKVILRKKVIAI